MKDYIIHFDLPALVKGGASAVIGVGQKTANTVKSIREEIASDIAAVRQRDPAARSNIEILLLYSGVHAILAYRVAHKL